MVELSGFWPTVLVSHECLSELICSQQAILCLVRAGNYRNITLDLAGVVTGVEVGCTCGLTQRRAELMGKMHGRYWPT